MIDDTLGDEVRVTVIAAGFDGGQLPPRRSTTVEREPARRPLLEDDSTGEIPVFPQSGQRPSAPRSIGFDDHSDDLDIPDFLK